MVEVAVVEVVVFFQVKNASQSTMTKKTSPFPKIQLQLRREESKGDWISSPRELEYCRRKRTKMVPKSLRSFIGILRISRISIKGKKWSFVGRRLPMKNQSSSS